MPDPIRGVSTPSPVTAANAAGQSATAKSTGAATPAASGSGIDLANVAQTEALLQTIVDAANNVPGIDQARVAELQQAIASGAYQANPQLVAEKFVELEGLLAAAGVSK